MLGQSDLPELQVGALPALTSMVLSQNMLRGKVPSSWGAALTRLDVLRMEENQLDRWDLGPDDYPGLVYINMSVNAFSGTMPNVLQLQHVGLVDFSHNSLTALPETWWHNMPTKKTHRLFNTLKVWAHHNKISGSLPPLVSLPRANGTFSLAADLSFNELSGSISASARNIGTTRHAYLIASHNRLTGTLPSNLMHWFSGAVDLSHNLLHGPCCPEQWYKWTSLSGLYLEHNMLRGPLPSIYSNWSSLNVLDLASNPLNTTIPEVFLGSFPWHAASYGPHGDYGGYDQIGPYREIYLSNCSLQGTLPKAWLSKLLVHGRALAIHSNPNLSGCLPPVTCNDPNPQYCIKLVSRNSSCDSCFPSGVLDNIMNNRQYGYLLPRFDCDKADGMHPYPIRPPEEDQANKVCDTFIAWPWANSTNSVGGACVGSWCAAISDTQVTGVCQP
jgi:hypothetical protein